MIRRILVPLDGTAFGDFAVPLAVSIAGRTGATLELVHVHHRVEADPALAALPQYQFEHVEEAAEREDEAALLAEDYSLEERASEIERTYGVRVVTRVLLGSTLRALEEEIADSVADLVVMSTHARSGLSRLRYGDLAHELVREMNIPTLCIRPPGPGATARSGDIHRILVTLDGSEFSEQILDVVVPLARALGARLSLLHVVSPASLMITATSGAPQRTIAHRTDAIEYLTRVAASLPADMPTPELIAVEAGDGASAIRAELERSAHDALAIATHGRSGLSRVVLGSVAEQLVRSTDKPVLLYRPRLVPLSPAIAADAFRA